MGPRSLGRVAWVLAGLKGGMRSGGVGERTIHGMVRVQRGSERTSACRRTRGFWVSVRYMALRVCASRLGGFWWMYGIYGRKPLGSLGVWMQWVLLYLRCSEWQAMDGLRALVYAVKPSSKTGSSLPRSPLRILVPSLRSIFLFAEDKRLTMAAAPLRASISRSVSGGGCSVMTWSKTSAEMAATMA